MRTIHIQTPTQHSEIIINEKLQNLKKYINNPHPVIITDTHLLNFYKEMLPPWNTIVIETGEEIKTLQTVENIYKKLLDFEVDRSSFIVGIGGGVVCDITGYVASTFMRGLPFGFVSTSLLSQVDASTGGKNGVNFLNYKNIIGTFNQPQFVICDPAMLKTLPQKELISGFGEVIKHAAIASPELFDFLEENVQKAINLDSAVMERVIYDCISIKADIVGKDERESGLRRILNFGHTLGHAVENVMNLIHGEAISMGMVFAAGLSVSRNSLDRNSFEKLRKLIESFRLPVKMNFSKEDKNKIINALRKDKKRKGEMIHFVLLKSIGQAYIEEIPLSEIERLIDNDMY